VKLERKKDQGVIRQCDSNKLANFKITFTLLFFFSFGSNPIHMYYIDNFSFQNYYDYKNPALFILIHLFALIIRCKLKTTRLISVMTLNFPSHSHVSLFFLTISFHSSSLSPYFFSFPFSITSMLLLSIFYIIYQLIFGWNPFLLR